MRLAQADQRLAAIHTKFLAKTEEVAGAVAKAKANARVLAAANGKDSWSAKDARK